MKSFNLIFTKDGKDIECNYVLHDSAVAEKWFHKIKHLKNIPIDKIESNLVDVGNIHRIYDEFCNTFNIAKQEFEDITHQNALNKLHEVYETNHEQLSRHENSQLLYKFHHAIHKAEKQYNDLDKIVISWGTKEGPLTEQYKCHNHYNEKIEKNNLYLPWAELGKQPMQYWIDKEPNTQSRINELCKPHITFRAKFFVSLSDKAPKLFDPNFTKWFEPFKKSWLDTYDILDYTEKHHYSAPLLAISAHQYDLDGAEFKGIAT